MVSSHVSTVWRVAALIVGVLGTSLIHTAALGQAVPNRENLACRLFPIAEIEAMYGAKAAMPPNGYISDAESTCNLAIAGGFVRIVSAPPGAQGVAPTVQGQLAALRSKIAGSQNAPKIDTKDYGDVGCLGITFTAGPDGRAYDKPIHETICLQLTGGYLLLHLASQDPRILSDDHVKTLLAKAAERRR